MMIIKSSGIEQEFDANKILKVIDFSDKIKTIDPYELLNAVIPNIKNRMTTIEIQDEVIRSAAGLISKESPDYQFLAANLKVHALRKEVYGQFEPIPFITHICEMVNKGWYDDEILQKWSAEEIGILEKYIDHDRDFNFAYGGITQMIEKYLIKDKQHGNKVLETPQYAYMLIGMCLHQDEKNNRMQYVMDFYDAVSKHQISLPTPIMAGVRSPIRQFSSCVVIESGDSLDSINDASSAIVKYISKRAGIGINAGMLRAQGSKIGAGEVVHTGVIPFWKHFQTAVKSCSQGGVRGGSATLYYPIWHLEYENLIVLKNNKGTDESRIRHLDYGVQINDLMIERFIKNEYITLFSPNVHLELYNSFFENPARFREIYLELEKNPNVSKKRIKASDAFSSFMTERANTARIYPQFVDNVNEYGPFIRSVAPIKMSNLCIDGDAVVNVKFNDNPLAKTYSITMLELNEKFHDSKVKQIYVESYDAKTSMIVWKKVINSALMNESAEVVKVSTADGVSSIISTPEHKFLTSDSGSDFSWKEAKDINGHTLLSLDSYDDVAVVTKMKAKIPVYDITVEETECFFANGILVHNCAEIALPTRDVSSIDALINLCTLSAFVLDSFDWKDQEEHNRLARIAVRALDNLLDYQDYPVKEALASKRMRSLGIGVINYAGWLASNFAKYGEESAEITHELFERMQYSLIKASVELAKEKGAMKDIHVSKYGLGQLPIDWYNKHVDELVEPNYVCDWEALRADLKKYGIRNATLTAQMPAETSASISNSTNGIEPPRSSITIKSSKSGAFKQLVPNFEELQGEYDYAWDIAKRSNKDYLMNAAIIQKFFDQSISVNTYYVPGSYDNAKVPMSVMMDDLLYAWYYSIKNMYYHNTHDGVEDDEDIKAPIPEGDDCESCKI